MVLQSPVFCGVFSVSAFTVPVAPVLVPYYGPTLVVTRCSALEGLSRREIVTVAWDPRPWEPVEGVLWATNVLELEAE
ncbi:hypothetical protein Taro_019040 [Colocasia esculenta]|uniref:Uncharacterized protein n=1 Tax=Colocasia esculenta TaxID=4460 RepID=A0A843USD5_COLES|nr:hypothetical protein [Colocasia esculenta]